VDEKEVEYRRASAEGIMCEMAGGCGSDTGGAWEGVIGDLVDAAYDADA
jgi:hypothetical protein